MKMFADDMKLWCKISSESDSHLLQQDLDTLTNWSRDWLLKFNPDICKVMHVRHDFKTRYFIKDNQDSVELQTVQEERDLGVHFTNDLKPSTHCLRSAAKARRIIGMVRRNFKKLDNNDFLLIYKTDIRPHLEYCVQARSPHLSKDIQCLESPKGCNQPGARAAEIQLHEQAPKTRSRHITQKTAKRGPD